MERMLCRACPALPSEHLGNAGTSTRLHDRDSIMYSLGYDIGSSSVKGAVINLESGATVASDFFPREEMTISAPHPGWAEQDPEYWWECVQQVTRALLKSGRIAPGEIGSIGISYQMHGLVIVDSNGKALRPSIIWCDSRAVEIGEKAFRSIGEQYCLTHLLNSPGNFTASKLRWVKENEPDVYSRIAHVLLPGDFIALRRERRERGFGRARRRSARGR